MGMVRFLWSKIQGSLTNQSFSECGDSAGFPTSVARVYMFSQFKLAGSGATPGEFAAEEMTEFA